MFNKLDANKLSLPEEWKSVLQHYLLLSTKKEKDEYVQTFTIEQQEYFLNFLKQCESSKDVLNEDNHIIGHKKYKQLKHKMQNQKKLVISAFIITVLLVGVGLLQTTFFAQIAGYIPMLKGGVSENAIVLSAQDNGEYEKWISGFLGKEYQGRNNDADNDGISNEVEFLLQSNPSVTDENKDGIVDGANLLQSVDPINSSRLSASSVQKLRVAFSFEEIAIRLATLSITKNQQKGVEIKKNQNLELLSQTASTQLIFPSLNINENILWQQNYDSLNKTLLNTNFIHIENTPQLNDQQTNFLLTTNPNISSEDINKLVGQEEIIINAVTETKQKITLTYRVISINTETASDNSIKPSETVNELAILVPTTTGEIKIQVIRAKLVKIQKVVEDKKDDLLPEIPAQ